MREIVAFHRTSEPATANAQIATLRAVRPTSIPLNTPVSVDLQVENLGANSTVTALRRIVQSDPNRFVAHLTGTLDGSTANSFLAAKGFNLAGRYDDLESIEVRVLNGTGAPVTYQLVTQWSWQEP